MPELHEVRPVERASDLAARDEREALDALEVRVLDHHDTPFREEGLGVVVDELAVDEAVDAVRGDGVDLRLHLFLCTRAVRKRRSLNNVYEPTYSFRTLELSELASAVDLDTRTEHLDFIRVHRYSRTLAAEAL